MGFGMLLMVVLSSQLLISYLQIPHVEPLVTNGSAEISIPGWGSGKLVALVSASVISQGNKSTSANTIAATARSYDSYIQFLVDDQSLQDLTAEVSHDGRLAIPQSEVNTTTKTWIFAFYQRRTGTRNLLFANNVTRSIFDNGSYVVDHFSAKGARRVADFWETHILDPETTRLLKLVGQNGTVNSSACISELK